MLERMDQLRVLNKKQREAAEAKLEAQRRRVEAGREKILLWGSWFGFLKGCFGSSLGGSSGEGGRKSEFEFRRHELTL